MSKVLRNFLEGFGSVLEIAPEPRTYERLYKVSDVQRLQRDYLRVADDVKVVFERVDKPSERQLSFNFSRPVDSSWGIAD